MKLLRSAPFSPLELASALQLFIFSCWLLVLAGAAGCSDRQLFMNDLRSSPLRLLDVASVLQVFIFSCWLLAGFAAVAVPAAWANAAGPARTVSAAPTATNQDVRFMSRSLPGKE